MRSSSQAEADAKRVKLEAEANAARVKQTGEADASALKARGEGEAAAVKAKRLAEADAIQARADALAKNQEAVINQQIAENLPQIVGEASKAFGNIDQLMVLNGTEGFGQAFGQVLGMGVAAVRALRGLFHNGGQPTNGSSDAVSTPKQKSKEEA